MTFHYESSTSQSRLSPEHWFQMEREENYNIQHPERSGQHLRHQLRIRSSNVSRAFPPSNPFHRGSHGPEQLQQQQPQVHLPKFIHITSNMIKMMMLSNENGTEAEGASSFRSRRVRRQEDDDAFSKNITKILEDLLKDYDKTERPSFRSGKATKVKINILVRSMGPISEEAMDYSMDCYFRQYWRDERLSFTGVKKNAHSLSINQLSLNVKMLEKIWKPDTYFHNGLSSYIHTITRPNKLLRISEHGDITYSMRLTIKAKCPMMLRSFPMDWQSCPLVIGSFAYTEDEVLYIWSNPQNAVGYEGKLELSQFDIKHTSFRGLNYSRGHSSGRYSVLQVVIALQRHTGYFLIQIYLPCTLLVIMSWVGFWLNREATSDRIGLGITTVLTLSTLSLESRTSLPKTHYATALDWFIICSFGYCVATLLEFAAVHYFTKVGSGEVFGFDEPSLAEVELLENEKFQTTQEDIEIVIEDHPLKQSGSSSHMEMTHHPLSNHSEGEDDNWLDIENSSSDVWEPSPSTIPPPPPVMPEEIPTYYCPQHSRPCLDQVPKLVTVMASQSSSSLTKQGRGFFGGRGLKKRLRWKRSRESDVTSPQFTQTPFYLTNSVNPAFNVDRMNRQCESHVLGDNAQLDLCDSTLSEESRLQGLRYHSLESVDQLESLEYGLPLPAIRYSSNHSCEQQPQSETLKLNPRPNGLLAQRGAPSSRSKKYMALSNSMSMPAMAQADLAEDSTRVPPYRMAKNGVEPRRRCSQAIAQTQTIRRPRCWRQFIFCLLANENYRRERQKEAAKSGTTNSTSKIDSVARILFPVSFGLFNLAYWYSYFQAQAPFAWEDHPLKGNTLSH
ncbi:uncharacterized protein LOC131878512 [Tigriopus californicus]|uniref:uncharacterized protein LOC131878512 n=1 Tax=Tigriopus californicus TaxID=6832 RepID=UPI0027DA64CF|nr:uncharacterized protein LOC131878512 [Tigriopus californicus]